MNEVVVHELVLVHHFVVHHAVSARGPSASSLPIEIGDGGDAAGRVWRAGTLSASRAGRGVADAVITIFAELHIGDAVAATGSGRAGRRIIEDDRFDFAIHRATVIVFAVAVVAFFADEIVVNGFAVDGDVVVHQAVSARGPATAELPIEPGHGGDARGIIEVAGATRSVLRSGRIVALTLVALFAGIQTIVTACEGCRGGRGKRLGRIGIDAANAWRVVGRLAGEILQSAERIAATLAAFVAQTRSGQR